MKYEIIRTDINKTVLKAMEFNSEEDALGQYMSVLMLAGIIRMGKKEGFAEEIEPHNYRLPNGWMVEVRAA